MAIRGDMTAFFGGNYNYQSSTKGFFYDRCNEPPGSIDPVTGFLVTCTKTFFASNPVAYGDTDLEDSSRGLVDLWAGVEAGSWRRMGVGSQRHRRLLLEPGTARERRVAALRRHAGDLRAYRQLSLRWALIVDVD